MLSEKAEDGQSRSPRAVAHCTQLDNASWRSSECRISTARENAEERLSVSNRPHEAKLTGIKKFQLQIHMDFGPAPVEMSLAQGASAVFGSASLVGGGYAAASH